MISEILSADLTIRCPHNGLALAIAKQFSSSPLILGGGLEGR